MSDIVSPHVSRGIIFVFYHYFRWDIFIIPKKFFLTIQHNCRCGTVFFSTATSDQRQHVAAGVNDANACNLPLFCIHFCACLPIFATLPAIITDGESTWFYPFIDAIVNMIDASLIHLKPITDISMVAKQRSKRGRRQR
jgi:hypothetical protein